MVPLFLLPDEVLAIHGKSGSIRDIVGLRFVVGVAAAKYEGVFVHESLPEMAAAYLYAICRNAPFTAGNRRTALACALAFLKLNGVSIVAEGDELYDLVIGVTEGRVTKSQVAVFIQQSAV